MFALSLLFLGDDQYVAIQMRGGPEPLMVTGWMQIMSLDPSYIGNYHCIATNFMGQVYEMATVGVYKNEELWFCKQIFFEQKKLTTLCNEVFELRLFSLHRHTPLLQE